MGRAARAAAEAREAKGITLMQTTKAYDRFGRELGRGAGFYWIGKHDTIWECMGVSPVLHPGAPPGLVEIEMIASVKIAVPGGKPLLDILRVLSPDQAKALAQGLGLEEGERLAGEGGEGGEAAVPGKPLIIAP